MSYLPLEQFKYAWVFRHQSMPVSTELMSQIKPMTEERSSTLWDTFISKDANFSDQFSKHDWPLKEESWHEQVDWESRWESDVPELPEAITDHINWEDNTTVYYVIKRKMVVETTWKTFKTCWKNFLFVDDGCFLMGKKRKEVVQFFSTGQCKVGVKPN